MKIIIAHTKEGENAEFVYKAFEAGALSHGDTCVHVEHLRDLHKIRDADVVFQVSYPFIAHRYVFCDEFGNRRPNIEDRLTRSPINDFRVGVFEEAIKNKKRLLSLDSGLLNFRRRENKNYYQISFDSIKNLGKYYNQNSPADRFNALDIEIKPWKKDGGKDLLVFGQVYFGVGSQHVDIRKWQKIWMLEYLTKKGRRPITFSGHPNNPEEYKNDTKLGKTRVIKFSKSKHFKDDFQNSVLAMTFCSHVIAECVVEGLPTYCYSKTSMGWPLFGATTVEEALTPKFPDREQWLYDMAYTQWHTQELENGTAWAHYRPHALKTEDVNWEGMLQPVCLT